MGGLHRHILPLRFMDFAVELHHRRRFRHTTGAGGQRGLAVLRQDLLLKMQTAAGSARLAVRLRLKGQAALGGEISPRMFHLPLRPFHPAHGLVIFSAGRGGIFFDRILCGRRGRGIVGGGGWVLKLQPPPL